MNKKLIRLTEQDLHRIVKESVNKILKEGDGKFANLYADERNAMLDYQKGKYTPTQELEMKIRDLEEYLEQLKGEYEQMCADDEEAWYDNAYNKYGLTRKNLEKNWPTYMDKKFSEDETFKHKHPYA